MAKKRTGGGKELLTLREVGERTGISMPTLLRYKKEHQDRIPSVGEGRTQRYPAAALEVFEAIRREGVGRRGRRKGAPAAAKAGRPKGRGSDSRGAAAGAGGGGGELFTLGEIGERTGISYATLRRYVEQHGERLPFVGDGRQRRYRSEAVAVFEELRAASRPGRKPGGAAAGAVPASGAGAGAPQGARGPAAGDGAAAGELGRRLASLETRQERLVRELTQLHDAFDRRIEATVRWMR